MMRNQSAYIDESGNNGLDFSKPNVSTHYVIGAIIVDDSKINSLEQQLEGIRKKYFQTSEMKSSLIKSNDQRRLTILRDLASLDFHIFACIFDKRKLVTEGFKYKASFYKYLHSIVDKELFKLYPNIQICTDAYGNESFSKGLVEYMEKNHIPDLFNEASFRVSNSKSELLVQLADIITGTIARCFEETNLSSNRLEFLEVIREKVVQLNNWPLDIRPYSFEVPEGYEDFESTIAELGANQALLQLEKPIKSPAEKDQSMCLRYLLFNFNINPKRYISTKELIHHINSNREENINLHYFRSKVIAKLRDHGVIISSCQKGYKLPSSKKDLYDFINHSNSYIQPMINRVIKCREKVKAATKNALDILDHSEYRYLKKLVE